MNLGATLPPKGEEPRPPAAQVAVPIEQMIREGGKSLIRFGHLFLPRMFRVGSPAFHYEMAAALEGPRRLLAFKVFRNAAKTSLLRAYMLKRICYCLSNVIMVVSASQGHASLSIQWLKGMIENNKAIRTAFDLQKGDKWSNEHIEIIRPEYEPDDPRARVHVIAAGITGQTRGFNIDDFRPDLILLDDGQTEESVGTQTQSAKTSDLTFGALLNSLTPYKENPQAKMVVLQTPMEHGDIIDMVSKSPLWTTYSYSIFDARGQSRWPEMWDTAQLLLEKADHIRMGKYSLWMREKEVTLVKSERMAFDMSKVKIIDRLPGVIHDRANGVDPASSDDKKADFQASVTVLRSGPDFIVVSAHAARGEMPDELAGWWFQDYIRWRWRCSRIESIHYQRVLAWFFRQEMTRRRLFPAINSIKSEGRRKADRIIQALVGIIANEHLFFYAPNGMLDDTLQTLWQQLIEYEPGSEIKKDDLADALSMAVEELDSPFMGGMEIEGSILQTIEAERREFGSDADVELVLRGAP